MPRGRTGWSVLPGIVMEAGTRGAAVPILPWRSNSSRPGCVPRIISPAPGIVPRRDWEEPGATPGPWIAGCVVSIDGAWAHTGAGQATIASISHNSRNSRRPRLAIILLLDNLLPRAGILR